jgi:amino acid adenylation domain-containing protein
MNELNLTPGTIEIAPDSVLTRDAERWSGGDHVERELSYWREQLEGIPAILELPTDRPRPPKQSFRAARESVVLPRGLKRALEELSERERVSVFVMLLAAYQTLLSRYTRQDDILVGCALPAREETNPQELIEGFASPAVIRTDMSGDPTFRQLLLRVSDATNGAREHQNVPWDRLVEAVQPDRDVSRHPVFQVQFSLDESEFVPEGWGIEDAKTDGGLKVDLHLQISNRPDELAAHFTYSTDLFDAATIVRMAGHYEKLLVGIVENPDQQITRLPLLSDAERHQIVVDWNDTRVGYPRNIPLHKLIEDQVEKTPDAPAVVYESQRLTFRQLNDRANQLAHFLQKRGVGPDVLVAVCTERSLEMVIALLAVIKAGGAYVPFDPEYPKDRLETMLRDANPPVVLTQAHLLDSVPEGSRGVFCLDRDWHTLQSESTDNLPATVGGKNLAYAIYTSGSTGKPKGVPNVHEGIVNRLLWMQDMYKLTAKDRVLQKTPFSFDVSVWEFFWPMLTGATLVVARPGGHRDPAYLVNLIAEQGITTLHFVPSMLSIFLEASGLERCRSIRQVFASGEALPYELQQRFFEHLGWSELHNLYGPTEAAVDVTYWACSPKSKLSTVPIGRPIANTQIYILDSKLQPVPIGVAGELHIGGIGLARGYLNRPELTAEKFIADPFAQEPGARLYKTGDLSRFLPDGSIEYLGRIDHQVKIRGFRIELGEIESVLRQHPAIKEAVVVAREDTPGDKRVAAYFVPDNGAAPATAELRAFMREKLPEYMLPSVFVTLKTMPLSGNGKVDRKVLPKPDPADYAPTGTFAAPKDAVESQLVEIWQTLLGVKPIGVKDNYFELGGHSILAVKMMNRIAETFGKTLPIATLLQTPTIEQLAVILRDKQSAPAWSCLVPIQKGGSKAPFFCIHGANGAVVRFHALAQHLGSDQPFYGVQANGLGEGQVCHKRTEDMAAHYLKEILAVQARGPYFLGGYSFGGAIAFEMAQQLAVLGEEVTVVLFDTYLPVPKTSVSTSAASVLLSFFRAPAPERPAYLWRIFTKPIRDVQWRLHVARLPHNTKKVRKACLQAEQEYRPRPYPGRVILFRSSYKPLGQVVDPRAEWHRYAARGLEICEIPGNHENILLEPQVRFVADHLGAFLNGSPAPLANTPQLTKD